MFLKHAEDVPCSQLKKSEHAVLVLESRKGRISTKYKYRSGTTEPIQKTGEQVIRRDVDVDGDSATLPVV